MTGNLPTATSLNAFETRIWTQAPEPDDVQFAYWNDEQVESTKAWNVTGGEGFPGQERHLTDSGLLVLLHEALEIARDGSDHLGRVGADLACGTAWAVPHLLQDPTVQRIYCVEYSRHRLFKLAPIVLAHYGVQPDRVTLCLGSFYELHLDDASLDFVILAEALHHADDPRRLLREVRRVLRPDGTVIIIGEHIVPSIPILYAGHTVRWFVSRTVPGALQRKLRGKTVTPPPALWASVKTLLAPHPVMGDHYYTDSEYSALFEEGGFRFTRIRIPKMPMQGFVLRPGAGR